MATEKGAIITRPQQDADTRPHQPGQSAFRSVLSEDIDWKPLAAFPPEVCLAVVVGEPSAPGPYVIRVKVSSGVKWERILTWDDRDASGPPDQADQGCAATRYRTDLGSDGRARAGATQQGLSYHSPRYSVIERDYPRGHAPEIDRVKPDESLHEQSRRCYPRQPIECLAIIYESKADMLA
jgi:hypothetical protein